MAMKIDSIALSDFVKSEVVNNEALQKVMD